MPFVENKGARIYWKLDGGDDKPPLVLLNSIGTDMSLWDAALPYLLASFRVVRIDTRGHGASDVPHGDYSLALLASDVVAVMNALNMTHSAIAGVSLGGMIAMELVLRYPDRVSKLALICTSASMDKSAWQERVTLVRQGGTAAIADLAMQRFLSPAFAEANPAVRQSVRRGLLAMSKEGYAGAAAAVRDMDLGARVSKIDVPTLVVSGSRDISTPFEGHGQKLVAAISGAQHSVVEAGHLAPIECPAKLAAVLCGFFLANAATNESAETLFEAGLVNRRRILGDEWVDRALAKRTSFNTEFQEIITRIAWQEIWGRPGLDDRTRRLLVVAMTASLGRWEEFELHVRAGLTRHGFTQDDLKEVLIQTAIYAGVPAANTAFAKAGRILEELARSPES